jgi:predicted nucleic acid-binding protein
MKIVLDTNVLISGIYFSGPPGRILAAWRSGKLQPAVSIEILEEYLNVAERLESRYSGVEYEGILDLFIQNTQLVHGA